MTMKSISSCCGGSASRRCKPQQLGDLHVLTYEDALGVMKDPCDVLRSVQRRTPDATIAAISATVASHSSFRRVELWRHSDAGPPAYNPYEAPPISSWQTCWPSGTSITTLPPRRSARVGC